MSSTYAESFARLEACLDEIGAVDPVYRSTSEKQEALTALTRARARVEAELMRVLAVADDVAETTGARSTAAWLAQETRDAHGRVRADATLAVGLDQRWTHLAGAFRAGRVNLAQVRVIADALAALPPALGDDILVKAELRLVEHAAHHGPRDLKLLGARILSVIAPEVADQAEYDALLAAERRASAATRLHLRPRGDGSTDLHARLPDLAAGMLLTYLAAFTNPRRRHHADQQDPCEGKNAGEFAQLPLARQRGIAFVALLERVLAKDLPRHGQKATTLAVLIPHDQLVADLEQAGIATTTSGERMTAGEARRLACNAGLLAAVLGTNSEVLDLGRETRLYQAHQRKGMEIRDKTCTEIDCTMPAAFCDAHHKKPWAQGGPTDLKDGTLLCPFHHHRAHDPRWAVNYHADGTTTFHRRQ